MNSKRERKHRGDVSDKSSRRAPRKPKVVRDLAAGEARNNRVVGGSGTAGSFKFFFNVEALP
jgi:hypothetical protein